MFELVSAQCPGCGAKLKVDSRQPMTQCEYCGQRSMLHRAGTPPLPPAPTPAGTPLTVIELPSVRRRVGLILLLTLLPMVLVTGLVFFIIGQVRDAVDQVTGSVTGSVPRPGSSFLGGGASDDDDDAAPLPPVSDYLAAPQDIAERVRRQVVDPPVVRSLRIQRSNLEVYPADGQRYSMSLRGKALRRGGAVPVPEAAFDLTTIDLSVLSTILAEVEKTDGAKPSKAVLEAESGTPQWTIHVRKDGKGRQRRFEIDGTPVED